MNNDRKRAIVQNYISKKTGENHSNTFVLILDEQYGAEPFVTKWGSANDFENVIIVSNDWDVFKAHEVFDAPLNAPPEIQHKLPEWDELMSEALRARQMLNWLTYRLPPYEFLKNETVQSGNKFIYDAVLELQNIVSKLMSNQARQEK